MSSTPSFGTDNGLLEKVAELSGQNLYACYQCGKCTADCPFSFGPQQVVRFLQLGQVEKALAHDTLWQCASCYTCVAACPKGVDPVRIMRALRTIDTDHGKGLRSRVFGKIDGLSKIGSGAMAPISNTLLKLPGSNLAAHQFLGIHKNRSLPPFARRTFPSWHRNHTPLGDGHRGKVLLFNDTFMDYNLPQVGIAATELLEMAGFRVELAKKVCCGRAMISKGFYDQAAVQARANVEHLYEQTREGAFIVGCEPSCLLTLRDEYPDLVEPEMKEQALAVGRQAVLIDEFLAMLSDKGELELDFDQAQTNGRSAIFHAHCQQKALADPAKSMQLLNMAGYQAELVNAACCGMAGSFGYEKEHYEASRAAGERGLFPAVRGRNGAEVVVMGISCRHQIEDFTDAEPRHLTQVLRDAVTRSTGN